MPLREHQRRNVPAVDLFKKKDKKSNSDFILIDVMFIPQIRQNQPKQEAKCCPRTNERRTHISGGFVEVGNVV